MSQPTVLVRNPDLDPEGKLDPARVSSRAFEKLYAPKGWRVVSDDGTYLASREDIASMSGPELDEILGADHGIRLVDDRRAAALEKLYPSPVVDEPLEPAAPPSTPGA